MASIRATGVPVLLMVLVGVTAGCSDRMPLAPTLPAESAEPAPAVLTWKVSGTVWVHGPGGVQAASSGTVTGWVATATSGRAVPRIPIGPDGRYQFDAPVGTSRVHVTGPRHQPCVVSLPIAGDVTADVHVVSDPTLLGGHLPAALLARQPTLSGVVYEQTPQGRRPLSNAWVTLDGLGGLGLMIADTLTDAEGRYVLCNVPALPSLAVVAGLTGFQVYESSVPVTGLTTLDIEMRRLPNGGAGQ